MIWFLFWIAFVLFVGWLFARSMKTIWRQQKTWGIFARKHNLDVAKGKWYQAPRVEGEINGRRINIYVEEVVDPVLRVREFRTTLEIYLKTGLPTGIAIGSRAYTSVLSEIENVEKMTLPEEKEFTGLRCVARDVHLFDTWKNAHLDDLKTFFSIKRAERLLMGHEVDGFLILQTADNLDDIKTLNTQVKQLFALAKNIEVSDAPEDLIEDQGEEVAEITPETILDDDNSDIVDTKEISEEPIEQATDEDKKVEDNIK